MFMLLFIAKGRNKQQHYGSPPEVGEPAHPGSFCKQNSLPGLPSRPHFVSDSSVTLWVPRGASRGLRPPLRGPLRGRARRFRHSPLRVSAPSCARPTPHGAAKTPCPPPIGSGGGALPPSSFFAASRLRLRLRQKTRRLPHQAAAWTGAGAPTSPSLAACPLRSRLAASDGKAAPRYAQARRAYSNP